MAPLTQPRPTLADLEGLLDNARATLDPQVGLRLALDVAQQALGELTWRAEIFSQVMADAAQLATPLTGDELAVVIAYSDQEILRLASDDTADEDDMTDLDEAIDAIADRVGQDVMDAWSHHALAAAARLALIGQDNPQSSGGAV